MFLLTLLLQKTLLLTPEIGLLVLGCSALLFWT
jgi:hypothetical protein